MHTQTKQLERQTPTHSLATTNSSELRWLASRINRLRVACGWNIIPAEELKIIGPVWLSEVARYGISPELMDLLCDRMIDNRVQLLERGEQAPNPSPESLLVEFSKYRSEQVREWRKRDEKLKYSCGFLRDVQEFVKSGQTPRATLQPEPYKKRLLEQAAKMIGHEVDSLELAADLLPTEDSLRSELTLWWKTTMLRENEPGQPAAKYYQG